ALPALVYVRASLRAYCAILGLRQRPVLACFDDHRAAWLSASQPAAPAPSGKPRGAVLAALAAGLMACSLVTWALYSETVELPAWRGPRAAPGGAGGRGPGRPARGRQ